MECVKARKPVCYSFTTSFEHLRFLTGNYNLQYNIKTLNSLTSASDKILGRKTARKHKSLIEIEAKNPSSFALRNASD